MKGLGMSRLISRESIKVCTTADLGMDRPGEMLLFGIPS